MKVSRLLMVSSSLILIIVYFIPIWYISLDAPQFPEGLGLYIYVNGIKGFSSNDLESINILNHYIGMKKIEPDEFIEFKIIPLVLALLIVLGLIISFLKSHRLKLSWIVFLILLALVGILDYYIRSYEYGHNLDPNAILKVPNMVYQPPLIGGKQLLNIYAFSFPHWGSAIILISLLFAFISYHYGKKEANNVSV